MKSPIKDPFIDDEVSLRWLIRSLAYGAVDALRRNKVATALASVTLVVLLALAADSRFDGLSQYQELILPRLTRLEAGFRRTVRQAQNSSGEWRLYYFENAHREARDILRAAKLARPSAHVARTKHREFIRYYELLDSEFHTLDQQLSMDPNLDYLSKLTAKMEDLKPIRDVWAEWANPQQGAVFVK